MVLGHGFGAVREAGLDGYARRFAALGYGALVFDYRHFGASDGQPRQLLDIGRQLADWRAAVDYARALPGVDPDRIALWGSSFSGGHVITVAAADPRIAAVVAQVPYLGLVRSRGLPQPRVLRLAAAGLVDHLRGLLGAAPHTVPLIGEPGSRAILQGHRALSQFRAMLPPGTDQDVWRNEVAARIVLRLPRYRPARLAGMVRCPVLFCACERDEVTPTGLIASAARASPAGTLITYPGGHFEIYTDRFEQVVADQAAFLTETLSDNGAG